MCGIFAIASNHDVSLELYKGLLALEYRGYDSCGIAVYNNHKIETKKNIGEVEEVNKIEKFSSLRGNIGIAHTRWATHGGVTKKNTHPHFANDKNFVIAHNGIIANYIELKEDLLKKSYNFESETDTEIIANLVQDSYKSTKNLEQAFLIALEQIEGSFAIVLLSTHKPDTIYGIKKDSPLIIGLSKNKNYIASDANAFINNTKEAIYIDDDEYIILNKKKIIIKDLKTQKIIKKEKQKLSWSAVNIQKLGFPHFMLKEIFDQPQTIKNSLLIEKEKMDIVVDKFLSYKQSFLIGVGTTYYVSMIGSYLFSQYANTYVPAISSDEFNNLPNLSANCHAMYLSQSGETYDTREALKTAKRNNMATSGIVNVVGSSISRIVGDCIYQLSGPEISVVSTKAALSQVIILMRLALSVGVKKNYIQASKLEELEVKISYFASFLEENLNEQSGQIRKLTALSKSVFNWLFLGRGIFYPIAMESALKMKEVTYLHTEGMSSGFLKHGSLAMIDKNICSLFFLPPQSKEKIYQSSISALEEVKARGGITMGFIEKNNPHQKLLNYPIYLPKMQPDFVPFYQLVILQLFSYYSALNLKRNIDKPRNLAKSVTVE